MPPSLFASFSRSTQYVRKKKCLPGTVGMGDIFESRSPCLLHFSVYRHTRTYTGTYSQPPTIQFREIQTTTTTTTTSINKLLNNFIFSCSYSFNAADPLPFSPSFQRPRGCRQEEEEKICNGSIFQTQLGRRKSQPERIKRQKKKKKKTSRKEMVKVRVFVSNSYCYIDTKIVRKRVKGEGPSDNNNQSGLYVHTYSGTWPDRQTDRQTDEIKRSLFLYLQYLSIFLSQYRQQCSQFRRSDIPDNLRKREKRKIGTRALGCQSLICTFSYPMLTIEQVRYLQTESQHYFYFIILRKEKRFTLPRRRNILKLSPVLESLNPRKWPACLLESTISCCWSFA